MNNGIPLGMGCGSSAAGRLAAIALAVHFGQLGWSTERILDEAYLLEGHPDNVAACWLGGFVAAACEGQAVRVAQVVPPAEWRAIVVLPAEPLPTSKARAVLPASYPLSDVVANIQSVSMLGLAFAQAPRRPAAHRHERPHSSALSGADLPVFAAAAAAGRGTRHSGRGAERRRPGGPGDRRERGELGAASTAIRGGSEQRAGSGAA